MTRFFTTVGHLTATLILFQTITANIELSFADNVHTTDKESAYQTSMGALAFSLLCFIVDIYGALSGSSILNSTINLIQIAFHFIGGLFLSWMITNYWNYEALWPIVICSNLPTAISEVVHILIVNIFRKAIF
jgi:hypothetical protein